MPERRAAGYACEDDARGALLAASNSAAADGVAAVDAAGGFGVAACLSLRWRRSGGPGFLVTADQWAANPAAGPAPDRPIAWVPLQDGEESPGAAAEWRLHHLLYLQRPDIEAIIRCRPTFATTLACSHIAADGIPAFHPDVLSAVGGSIPRADCGLPGVTLRPQALVDAIRERQACLLAGWGLLACGASLPAAVLRAAEVEALARIWWHLLQLEPHRRASAAAR